MTEYHLTVCLSVLRSRSHSLFLALTQSPFSFPLIKFNPCSLRQRYSLTMRKEVLKKSTFFCSSSPERQGWWHLSLSLTCSLRGHSHQWQVHCTLPLFFSYFSIPSLHSFDFHLKSWITQFNVPATSVIFHLVSLSLSVLNLHFLILTATWAKVELLFLLFKLQSSIHKQLCLLVQFTSRESQFKIFPLLSRNVFYFSTFRSVI